MTDLDDPTTIRELLATELPDDDRGGQARRRLEQRLEAAEELAAAHEAAMSAEVDFDAIADKVSSGNAGYATSVNRTWGA